MSDLIVSFVRISTSQIGLAVPVEVGGSSRTEAIAIGASSERSTYSAASGEAVVDVLAGADCWVEVGANPTAAAVASNTAGNGTGTSRKMLSGERMQFTVAAGDKVAVITG